MCCKEAHPFCKITIIIGATDAVPASADSGASENLVYAFSHLQYCAILAILCNTLCFHIAQYCIFKPRDIAGKTRDILRYRVISQNVATRPIDFTYSRVGCNWVCVGVFWGVFISQPANPNGGRNCKNTSS